jgi:hypothetical protein
MPVSARLSADRSDEMNRTRQCVQRLGDERSGERELLGVSERQRGVKSPLQLVVTAGVRPWTIHLHHIDGLYTGRRRLAFRFRCANAEKFFGKLAACVNKSPQSGCPIRIMCQKCYPYFEIPSMTIIQS